MIIDDRDEHENRSEVDDKRRRRLGLVKKVNPPSQGYVPSPHEEDKESSEKTAMRIIESNLAQYIV